MIALMIVGCFLVLGHTAWVAIRDRKKKQPYDEYVTQETLARLRRNGLL